MNFKTIVKTFALLAGTFSCYAAQAVEVTRVTIDRSDVSTSHNMYESGKIYFSGSKIVLDTMGNGNEVRYALSEINQMRFATIDISNTGVERVLSATPSLSLYPIPAQDELTISTNAEGSFTYTIYSVTGEVVLKGEAKDGSQVDISSLSKGVYLFEVNGTYVKISKL